MEITDFSSTMSIFAAIVTIIGGLYGFYKWSFNKGRKSAVDSMEKIVFEQLYSPLRSLLVNTRFATYSSISYPSLSQRLANAWKEVITRKHLKGKIRCAFAAMRNKGESMTVECDTGFPQVAITELVQKVPHLVNRELMDKLHEVEVKRSCPWEFDEQDLLQAQYRISCHIVQRYEGLAKKFT
ncbi:hypothetical protein [Vibrio harveyi]|uniref:hypothetical protein n=1 Tax=Vibrio harveyi TaxID=669 RepID=UPI00211A9160|nr:hypothetical protein [Vibrio harveyi]MCQ9076733.1 hypothetical protein [Vibrio harveyi]